MRYRNAPWSKNKAHGEFRRMMVISEEKETKLPAYGTGKNFRLIKCISPY